MIHVTVRYHYSQSRDVVRREEIVLVDGVGQCADVHDMYIPGQMIRDIQDSVSFQELLENVRQLDDLITLNAYKK